ncbi:MAG: TonB-linked SusC/RagA family outer membrane protein [Crocinitomicaceae bacterium]|jgi:TonB-linked SusC/RagA family outer membrane protein
MKTFLLTLTVFGWSMLSFAQTVQGTVLDSTSSSFLFGAKITDNNSDSKTKTDADGNFILKVAKFPASITVSARDYKTKVLTISSGEKVNLTLSLMVELDDIVVTALSVERSNKDLGYSVQTLKGKELSAVKSVNILDNLAGQIAGVTVSQGASGVGSSSKITIRGEASFTSNNPLFVIDGIIINNNSIVNPTSDAASGFQSVDFGNGAMDINADDVESVSVLKGPAAAALYGTRASNGVVIITTKKGKSQKGLGISFNSTTYIESAFKLPEFQNSYGQGNNGQFSYADGQGGGINDGISYSWGPSLNSGYFTEQFDSPVVLPDGTVVSGGDIAVHGGATITPTEMVSHPDNLKDFYQTGLTSIQNLAISNRFDKGSMRISLTDTRSKGILPGVNLNRLNAMGNFNFTPTDKLTISSVFQYAKSGSDNRPSSGYGSENLNYALVAWGPRSLDINAMEDYWQPGLEGLQQYSFNYTYFDNPYFTLLENRNSFGRDRLIGNIVVNYEILNDLSITLRTGTDYSSEAREFRRAYSSNRFQKGAFAEQAVLFRENNSDFLINYEKHFSKWGMEISAGGNRMDQIASQSMVIANELAQPGIYRLSNASVPLVVDEYSTRKRINSLYALAKFNYKRFIYLDITGRNDWSSALATPTSSENVSFFYPSASVGVILSRMMTLPESISFAKVRASVAQVGNDTDPYQTTGVYIPQVSYNNEPTFSAQSTISNANLLPERTTNLEFGLDLRFFKNRLRFDATYYNASTTNQIIALPVAISSGYAQQIVNGAKVRSSGVEIFTSVKAIDKKNFNWNLGLNFSRNVSTVEDLPDGATKITLAYNRIYDNVNQTVWYQVEEGGRIGDMYGTGYLKTEDGRFIIDNTGHKIVDPDVKKMGNYNPDFILAMNNSFTYKNFDLSFLFDWRQGGILVSRTQALAGVAGQLAETEYRPEEGIVADGVVNVGTEENPEYIENTTAISAESYYREYYDRNHEENNTYDASYLKMRQFSIGYTFRNDEKSKGLISDKRTLKVSIIGRNLFAISKIPHFDPEQLAIQGQKFTSGVENMSYASTRSIGIKLGYNF